MKMNRLEIQKNMAIPRDWSFFKTLGIVYFIGISIHFY